jgi:hypothetical protein
MKRWDQSSLAAGRVTSPPVRDEFNKDFSPCRSLQGGPVTMSGVAKAIADHELYGGYKVQGLMPNSPYRR